jgi:hypothetical protein
MKTEIETTTVQGIAAHIPVTAHDYSYRLGPFVPALVTADNLEIIAELGAGCDQMCELETGCVTWGIKYEGGQRGQMTVWPNGRAALYLGGDSIWGDWSEESQTMVSDDGETYDDDGERIEEEEEE